MNNVEVIRNGSMIVGTDGRIVAVGPADEIEKKYKNVEADHVLDAKGKCILPGLIDGHTHPVWSGDRVGEFTMKLAGKSYMEIHKAGGGIGFTVRHVRETSEKDLYHSLMDRLDRMLSHGTTTLEAKSGYGLDLKNEVKLLKVLHQAKLSHPIEVVGNYCGAHSVPSGSTAKEATKDIIENQLPEIKRLKDAGEISPELIDVFCEKNVFEIEDSKKILLAGKKIAQLHASFHGDELTYLGGAEMAGEIDAVSVAHLEHVSEAGIKALASKNIVAVLLPTTAYILRIAQPPARKLIDQGAIVALGTDFNPNAHCLSMPFVMNLACILMKLTPNEALVAATLNSAASLLRSHEIGSLEVGKFADFLVLNSPTWEHIIYQLVDPPIEAVYKRGSCAYQKRQSSENFLYKSRASHKRSSL